MRQQRGRSAWRSPRGVTSHEQPLSPPAAGRACPAPTGACVSRGSAGRRRAAVAGRCAPPVPTCRRPAVAAAGRFRPPCRPRRFRRCRSRRRPRRFLRLRSTCRPRRSRRFPARRSRRCRSTTFRRFPPRRCLPRRRGRRPQPRRRAAASRAPGRAARSGCAAVPAVPPAPPGRRFLTPRRPPCPREVFP